MGTWIGFENPSERRYCIPDYQKSKKYLCTWDPFDDILEVEWTTGNYVAMDMPTSWHFLEQAHIETLPGFMSEDETMLCWPDICMTRHNSGKGNKHVTLASHTFYT